MVNHFTRLLRKPKFSQLENSRFSNSSSTYTLSSVDKKGRIFIPIKLRFKLRFLEGSFVRLYADKSKLIVEKEGSE